MHVAVLGAGVTGVTTAYYLAELGHTVTVIDQAGEVAAATSHANGGQLSYSYTDSLARPEFIWRIPSLVLGLDPAIDVRFYRNARLFSWGLGFLTQCTERKARDNTVAVLEIALRSAALIDELQRTLNLDFCYRTAGKFVVLAEAGEIEGARQRVELKKRHGCDTEILSYEEAVALEPALAAMHQRFAAAVYSTSDQVGDARAFTAGLIEWLRSSRQVELKLGERVLGIEAAGGRLGRILTDRDGVRADAAVVCLGPWSPPLLKPLGIRAPIYPVRGYSVTLPRGAHPPAISVTNLAHRIVYTLLGDRVRIAGFADFVGYRTDLDAARQRLLLDIAERIAPEAADYGAADVAPWGGCRPVTPSSRPLVGATPIEGLYLNTGHGVLGWTLACATAHDVAAAVDSGH